MSPGDEIHETRARLVLNAARSMLRSGRRDDTIVETLQFDFGVDRGRARAMLAEARRLESELPPEGLSGL